MAILGVPCRYDNGKPFAASLYAGSRTSDYPGQTTFLHRPPSKESFLTNGPPSSTDLTMLNVARI
ncbi:MAG: hypothetical protein WCE90_13190 [Candidatus Zixiibacteriota bacterium]